MTEDEFEGDRAARHGPLLSIAERLKPIFHWIEQWDLRVADLWLPSIPGRHPALGAMTLYLSKNPGGKKLHDPARARRCHRS